MKTKRLMGRWRPWLGLLALGTFAFGLTLEGATSGKTKRDSNRDDMIGARSARIMGQSAQLKYPRGGLAHSSAGEDPGATDPHKGIDVIQIGRIEHKNLPIAPAVTVNPFEDEASRMRRSGEIGAGPWRPRQREAVIAGGGLNACGANPVLDNSACSFDIDCDDCNPCTQDRCIIDVAGGDGRCDGLCLHTSLDGQASTCSDGLFCNGIEICQSNACQLAGQGTGSPSNPNLAVPCDGICASGPRNSQRCDCPGGNCPDRVCVGGSQNGQPCSPPATACTNGGGTCPQPECVGGDNDGQTCNLGCGSGSCLDAICDEGENNCTIPCTVRVCSSDSTNAAAPCSNDGECPGGVCYTPDQVCDDRLVCNGQETCDLGTGLCVDGEVPCGPGATCTETVCSPTGSASRQPCLDSTDCATGQVCDVYPNRFGCYFGRCCTDAGGGAFTCSVVRYRDSNLWDPNDPSIGRNCNGVDQNWFAPGGGRVVGFGTGCPDDFQCPKYSSGIIPPVSTADGVLVFPISPAVCSGLTELGDDYTVSNGSHIALSQLRFAGGVQTVAEERISFEFYDAAGNFIEDLFFVSGSGLAIRTVNIDPPITIPPSGFVVARVAEAFAPNGRILWLSTDVEDIGVNDADKLWVDGNIITTGDWLERCDGGANDGGWCNPALGGSDCPSGTCNAIPHVLNFEMAGAKVDEPLGACCDNATGTCDGTLPWTCSGKFLGEDTLCATCGVGTDNFGAPCRVCSDNVAQSCLQNSECTSGMCVPNDAACSQCTGSSVPEQNGQDCNVVPCTGGTCTVIGGACVSELACTGGACCNPGTGECTEGTVPVADSGNCPDADFQGYGTDCFPDCCEQPNQTGGDNCEDAHITRTIINVPTPGPANAITVTISGDNSNASLPDSCTAGNFDPGVNDQQDVDLGWWEAFELDACAFVRLDLCCTDPIHAPQWVIMWDACPCEAPGGRQYFNQVNPNEPDEPANNRGAPYCDDDNLWWKYGPLPAGTYYQPIFSALAGHVGPYQLHITVQGCPEAACCYLECVGGDNNGNGCSTNADCTGGGSCNSFCDVRNVLDCERARPAGVGGTYLGLPNRSPAVTECGNVCDTGSCCPGPGVCVDDIPGQKGFEPMDKAECDTQGGIYVGGIGCFGGTCFGGDRDGLSCREDSHCPDGGTCTITEEQEDQRSPCPICEFGRDQARCQLRLPTTTFFSARLSDECVATCSEIVGNPRTAVAEDFIAEQTGDLEQICILGSWLEQGAGLADCWTQNPPDDWTLYLFEDNNSIPGTLITQQPLNVIAKGVEFVTAGSNIVRYALGLTTPVELTQGNTYWMSITANSDGQGGSNANCDWFWRYAEEGQGNEFSYQDNGANIYTVDDIFDVDYAFCVNLPMSVPPPVLRPCCGCAPTAVTAAGDDPNCENDLTFRDCSLRIKGEYMLNEAECAGLTCPNSFPPDNDACLNSEPVTCGADLFFNSVCATSSSPPLDSVSCEGATLDFRKDIWYSFTADVTGSANIALCDEDFEYDSVMAVYTDGTGTCPCPSDGLLQVGCGDDGGGNPLGGCVFTGNGAQATVSVTEGVCYTVRIGGFGDVGGVGHLRITCGEGAELGVPGVGDDLCAGGSSPGATCSTNADCPGGGVCGTKNRVVTVKPNLGAVAGGSPVSIKVTVLENPVSPGTVGQSWFAGPEADFGTGTGLRGAELQCTSSPHTSSSWTTGNLQIYGTVIVPGARYEVAMCDASGASCGPARVVTTTTWGNIRAPHGSPNFGDVNAILDRFRGVGDATNNASRTDLIGPGSPGTPNLINRTVNFSDVQAGLDAFRGIAFPYIAPTCTP